MKTLLQLGISFHFNFKVENETLIINVKKIEWNKSWFMYIVDLFIGFNLFSTIKLWTYFEQL